MSKIFKVDEKKETLQRGSYRLDNDLYSGFKTAAFNNQIYLAFEYLTQMMEIIDEKLDELCGAQPGPSIVVDDIVESPKSTKAPKVQKVETGE